MLSLQAQQREHMAWSLIAGLGSLGQTKIIERVRPAYALSFARDIQLLARVLADRGEHRKSWLATNLGRLDQARLDKRLKASQDSTLRARLLHADPLSRVERPAA